MGPSEDYCRREQYRDFAIRRYGTSMPEPVRLCYRHLPPSALRADAQLRYVLALQQALLPRQLLL